MRRLDSLPYAYSNAVNKYLTNGDVNQYMDKGAIRAAMEDVISHVCWIGNVRELHVRTDLN